MATLNPVQWSFIDGQVGKKYRGSVGADVYFSAYEYGLNVLVNPQGNLIRRPGTKKVPKVGETTGPYSVSSATGDLEGNSSLMITFNSSSNIEYRIIF